MKPKILIADDEVLQHALYEIYLDGRFEIIRALDGNMAVEKYKDHNPDLTLMDINMPRLPGDEAITRILEHDPTAKIVAVTGNDVTEEDLGVPVLKKVFGETEFMEIVEANLGRKVLT